MKHELQQRTIGILSRCMDTTIATIRPDGSPQATVVSFVLLLYFGCEARLAESCELFSRRAFQPLPSCMRIGWRSRDCRCRLPRLRSPFRQNRPRVLRRHTELVEIAHEQDRRHREAAMLPSCIWRANAPRLISRSTIRLVAACRPMLPKWNRVQ